MKSFYLSAFFRLVIVFVLPIPVYAQSPVLPSALEGYTFSYSILEVEADNIELLASVRNDLLAQASLIGGIIYATWVAVDKPVDAPFAGLEVPTTDGFMFIEKRNTVLRM